MFAPENTEQLIKTLHIHMDPEHYLQEQKQKASADPSATYQGSGYMHPGFAIPESERLRIAAYSAANTGVTALPAYSQQAILRMRALCEENDTKMLVIIFPYLTATMLAEPDYLAYNALLRTFCAKNDIPCIDFTLATEALMPSLDGFFQNTEHMSVDGTMALSRAFCDVFARYRAGEDVSALFYADTQEYLAAIDRVTNVWLSPQEAPGVYLAQSHYGTGVTPEYRFAAIGPDGQETTLRDYAPDALWQGDIPAGHTLRVYARAQQRTQAPVYFDQL